MDTVRKGTFAVLAGSKPVEVRWFRTVQVRPRAAAHSTDVT